MRDTTRRVLVGVLFLVTGLYFLFRTAIEIFQTTIFSNHALVCLLFELSVIAGSFVYAFFSHSSNEQSRQPLKTIRFDATPDPAKSNSTEAAQKVLEGLFGVVLGGIFLVAGLALAIETRDFMQSSVVVQGRVVRFTTSGAYHLEVEFTTPNGKDITTPQSVIHSDTYIGEQVPVRYRPDSPRASAKLDNFYSIWGLATEFSLMGGIFFLASINRIYRALSRKAKHYG
jgi:hypothetical protein